MPAIKRAVNVIPLTRVGPSSSQLFTYLVPPKFHDEMRPGQLLKIPFGRREILGVTSGFEMHRREAEAGQLKPFLELLDREPVLTKQNLLLAQWLADRYVCSLGLAVKAMLPPLKKRPPPPATGADVEKHNPDFVLTEHQRQAVAQISAALGKATSFLLHGVTGSGKTEVYMQVMERLLGTGKQAIVLVPEISLTDPAVERYARRFGAKEIALLHSRLGPAQRAWVWQRIRAGEKKIIIGPRSAVFAPVRDLGLLVLDEEHDPSFKQYDQNPKYHAREVAKKLAELWRCPLVLGDATPSVETFYAATRGEIGLLPLPHRIKADVGLPKVHVVDLRKEQESSRRYVIMSEYLRLAILDNLRQGRQIILFLNRRGAATFVFCRDCGYVAKCADCAVSLVWHEVGRKLLCHHCGKKYAYPEICPHCQGHRLQQFGLGTQAVEEELTNFLARQSREPTPITVARMDRDTTGRTRAHSRIYQDWAAGRIRILIGTQMVTKGWDISQVGLVGIISADGALHLPDFRSNERTFQLLTQVAGRAGRGKFAGLVVLQTYNPENAALEAVKTHDYAKFFQAELLEREKFHYPPYSKLVKLTVRHKEQNRAQEKAQAVAERLSAAPQPDLTLLGPAPAFLPKLRGKYQYQIVLKIPRDSPLDLAGLLRGFPREVEVDVDPENLL